MEDSSRSGLYSTPGCCFCQLLQMEMNWSLCFRWSGSSQGSGPSSFWVPPGCITLSKLKGSGFCFLALGGRLGAGRVAGGGGGGCMPIAIGVNRGAASAGHRWLFHLLLLMGLMSNQVFL